MKSANEFIKKVRILLIFLAVILPYSINKAFSYLIKNLRNNLYLPIYLSEFYMFFTLFIFYFGPIKYPIVNFYETLFLLISYNLFFIVGYIIVIRRVNIYPIFKELSIKSIDLFILLGSMFGIFLAIQFLFEFSGSINLYDTLRFIMNGLTNPSEGYLQNLNTVKLGSIFTKMQTLFSPILHLVIALGTYFFKRLKPLTYSSFVIFLIAYVSTYIVKGTNFGIIYVFIVIFACFAFNKNARTSNFGIIGALVFSFIYFVFSISNRMKLTEIPASIFHIPVDSNNFLFQIFKNTISIPLMIASSYLSQGYYGFSLSSQYSFISTFGFGSGRFLIDKIHSLFNIDLWSMTYQSRMDYVWDSSVNWHTIFLWISNDVGKFGVMIVMLGLGILFGLVIKSVIENQSKIAISLLPLYILMILFFPANNIIFDNPIVFMPFITLNILFLFSNRIRIKI